MTPPIEPELYLRLRDFVARYADKPLMTLYDSSQLIKEAKELAELLPEPVDPDLLEARKVILESYGTPYSADGKLMYGDGPARVADIEKGAGDTYWETKAVVAAIKRGRELAQAQQ